MSAKRTFPENAWYVGCTSDEIDDGPLGRTVCGEKIVFYRPDSNRVAALTDFCPHRGAPLSLGSVTDGQLRCGYHGMKFNADGSCAGMAGQRKSLLKKSVQSYPVVERYGYVWLWPGDTEQANPDDIPDLEWADSADWAFGGGRFHINCDFRLLIDNLMDLTHETYVHATSIGQPEIEEAAPETSVSDGTVIVSRMMPGIMAPPFWQDALKGNNAEHDVPVDRWQICRFSPPGSVMIDVGVAHEGRGGINADESVRASGIVVDLITPETETSCWYFWGLARNFNVKDKALTNSIRESQERIFAEDVEMLESQQANLAANPDTRLAVLDIDAGGAHSRKMLQTMIAAES